MSSYTLQKCLLLSTDNSGQELPQRSWISFQASSLRYQASMVSPALHWVNTNLPSWEFQAKKISFSPSKETTHELIHIMLTQLFPIPRIISPWEDKMLFPPHPDPHLLLWHSTWTVLLRKSALRVEIPVGGCRKSVLTRHSQLGPCKSVLVLM